MARFVLTPCRIRENKIVADDAPMTLDWPAVTKLLAPSKTYAALMTLRRLRVNAYVGLFKAQGSKAETNFLFQNAGRSNEIDWILRKSSDFADRVKVIYRVDEALYDSKFEEFSTGQAA